MCGCCEPGGEADLALEALRPERGGELGVEDLQGDGAVMLEVVGEIDGRHAAAPELALEAVAVLQSGGERLGDVGHADGGVSSQSRWAVGVSPGTRAAWPLAQPDRGAGVINDVRSVLPAGQERTCGDPPSIVATQRHDLDVTVVAQPPPPATAAARPPPPAR